MLELRRSHIWVGICIMFLFRAIDGYGGEPSGGVLAAKTESKHSDDYKLVWQDLFDGNKLNEKCWNIEVNGTGCGNNELQFYLRENVSFGKEPESGVDCLILTARKENYKDKQITSGRLNTKGKVDFKYGKIEARIKLPRTSDGLWPAFWLLGADISTHEWPLCGEIDILEMGHADGIREGTQERCFNGACHWGKSYRKEDHNTFVQALTNAYDMQDDFHLYTLVWDENSIRMYLDQDKYPAVSPYFEFKYNEKGDYVEPASDYFKKPYFVIFNLAAGGNFPGIWDPEGITALKDGKAYMYIDYVKIYQKGSPEEEFSGPVSGHHYEK